MSFLDRIQNVLAPAQKPGQPASNVPGQPNQNPAGTGNTPDGQKQPLDAYAELFKPQDPSKKAATPPSFSLDPKIVDQAADSMDFFQSLPPDIQEGIQGGDSKAFIAALNHVGRSAYKNSITHMSSLTDRFVGLRSEFDQTNLGPNVQKHLVKNTINSSFANANPVARQSLDWVSEKMREAFPDASPDWIAKQAPQFFVDMARAIAPDQFQQPDAGSPNSQESGEETNWANWLTDGKAPQP